MVFKFMMISCSYYFTVTQLQFLKEYCLVLNSNISCLLLPTREKLFRKAGQDSLCTSL